MSSMSSVWAASQETQVKEANELFKKQQWDSAVDVYLNALEHPEHADIVQYDLGTAFYKKENYDQSIEHLQKAISDKDKKLSAKVHYNLGNALYKKGRSLENNKIDEAIGSMQKSLDNYDKTLRLNSKDKDAKYNREFVEKELERLKKKKEEQKKEQQQEQQKDQPKQDKSQDKNKDNQQNQNNQDKQKDQPKDSSQEKQEEEPKSQKQKDKGQQQQQQSQQPSQDSKDKASPKPDVQEGKEGKPQSLEEKQAQAILEEYERQDAPKGLLNFVNRRKGEAHVERDW
jgi:Ca-activated chloride channel family protein